MNKEKIHSTREKLIRISFKAPFRNLQLFLRVTSLKITTILFLLFSLIFSNVNIVESKRFNSAIHFGVPETINVFPASVSTVNWSAAKNVLIQDLSDDAIYQDFDAKTSAYISKNELILPQSKQLDSLESAEFGSVIEDSNNSEISDETDLDLSDQINSIDYDDTSADIELNSNSDIETGELEEEIPWIDVLPEEKKEIPEIENTEETVQAESVSFNLPSSIKVLRLTEKFFPLLQLSITTSTENVASNNTDTLNENESPANEIDVSVDLESKNDSITEDLNLNLETEEEFSGDEGFETEQMDIENNTDLESVTSEDINQVDESITDDKLELKETVSDLENIPILDGQDQTSDDNYLTHEIVLSGFSTAALSSGQFLTDVQLRLSFAAKLAELVSENVPYVEVWFGASESLTKVGVILLENEVSNALNGGYFLFALPDVKDVGELKDFQVVIRYRGDKEILDGMFLDSAWIQLNTKTITEQDLLNRGKADQMKDLLTPEFTNLVSDKVNFKQNEKPVFNLRYLSQRNFIVRGFRNVTGQDLVAVESVAVKHKSLGLLPIEPKLTVTKDGLLSIEIPDEFLKVMRPGSYRIELVLNEGGKEFIDSFDFQWGILTTNPNKSEYQVGETAHISIGALTPNGNTICRANLDLYVTDPLGFVSKHEVIESGQCNGNNVIDVPDFSAFVPISETGVYQIYLERVDDNGEVLGFTTDTFNVVPAQEISIERTGPTRIYPPAPYPITLTVSTTKSFVGKVTEYVPASFDVFDTEAMVTTEGEWKKLVWNLSILGSGTKSVSYSFDAPDISPYLFNLGPARLDSDNNDGGQIAEDDLVNNYSTNVFIEHRRWQIASDAVGNMILFWSDGASIPTDWTCLSCGSGTFFERFALGSSTYNTTGGSLNHNHTALGSVAQTTSGGVVENRSGTVIAANDHSHTFSPTIGTADNLPEYRTLRVIQYTAGAGEPPTIPAGAIAVFDATVPTGWTRYSAHDGYYIYGANTIGTTGGSNTHTHSVSGTVTASGGATIGRRGGGTQVSAAAAGHTHTVSTTSQGANHEPPYIEVILGEIDADGTPPVGMVSMWTEDVPAGWINVSSDETAPFSGRFVKGAASYGVTGGSLTHSHSDTAGVVTSIANTPEDGQSGAFGASVNHTHIVDVTDFSDEDHLPPYLTVVFGKRIGLGATYTQANYRWYQNNNAQTPTTPWNTNLAENEPIILQTTPLTDGDIARLRINVEVTNATSTIGEEVKLQYASSSVCTSATVWTDVGDISSGVIWRGYNNTSVTDGSTLSSTLLASSTVSLTYEETGASAGTPNEIPAGGFGEWDFVIQNNGAEPGTEYCFRLVYTDDTPLFAYNVYPQLITNASPAGYQLQKRFDNENTSETLPTFDFFAVDPEADDINYQVQIASDFAFSSVVVDRNSDSHSSQFENQVLTSEKNPFTSGQVIRFTNTTGLTNGNTYWWRVRGRDPDGSDVWGGWSTLNSFSVSTTLTASGWLQSEDEQFARGILSGVEVYGSNQVRLITGSTTGTITSPTIDFNQGEEGTAWDSLNFTEDTTNGSIVYRVEYRNGAGVWNLIPDGDLTGNSTGFSTSPVSLLGLDVGTYRFIRVVATLNNVGGTPFLQEWSVDWGYRVETPTIDSPFANEKVGTTTPTFTFSTTDPQDDSLTYQIEWSTDVTFATGVTTRTSDTDIGFVNLNDGGDTDPFNSNDTILFTMQVADALTNGTTYWWRVRAKDTTGDNEYSFWTTPRSFTIDNTVTASTWFQTTEQQFESNVLSGTTGVSGGVTVSTVAQEALIVYGEGTVTTPRYRIWNGSEWSDEGDLIDINSTTRWVVTRAGTTREEYVAATVGANGHVIAQVYSLGEWDNEQSMTTTVGSTATKGFDVAYETVSGRALVVYCKGNTEPAYRIWNGSTWSAETIITQSVLTSDCRWVQLASDPTSDEIIMALRGSATSPHQALVWNGTTWGNSQTIGAARVATYEGASIEYEESGNQAVMVAASTGGGPNRFDYITWNGTTWSGPTTYNAGTIQRLYWPKLTRNRGTDELALCYVADNSSVRALRWTGSGWASESQLTATVNNVADPAVSCVFENTSGRDNYIMAAYSNTTATEYEIWNTTAWTTSNTQINSIVNTATMQLIRTDNDAILGVFFDYGNTALRFSGWNGTAWSTTETLEDDVSVTNSPYGYPYWMTPRNPGSEGTVVVSPAINFTDGVGPYFNEFSWNDTLPGASEIVYQLQYFNGTSWQFIPNSDLSGNEAGFTTGPIDLSGLNINTYDTIRPYATLSCDGASNCPTLNDWTITWAEGITVSGTVQEYDQVTNVTAGTVAVAVNGVLQIGKTGSVSAGLWSVSNVTVFPGDIVTVFLTGATDEKEAVGVTRYNGFGDIDGMELYERHLSLGSDNATTTPLTNANIGLYDYTNTEDVFFSVNGTTLNLCVENGCSVSNLYVKSGTYYTPGGRFVAHDFENNGIFTAGNFTHDVAGSWLNVATTTMTGSTIVFSATSTTESIASVGSFNNVTLGTTTGSGTWTLLSALDVNGALTVSRGILARGTTSIAVAGNLLTGANGFWTGLGTTTFDGGTAATWADQNSTLQNIGHTVIDGTNKIVTLAGSVAAQSITIGANDTLDASGSNHNITLYGRWLNQNIFLARSGTVFFAATTTGQTITTNNRAFYNIEFSGIGGAWSFTEPTLTANNNFIVATGTVTLPTATTTIGGSFDATGGLFAHNNGTILFTANSAQSITFDGSLFTNVAHNLVFNGGGNWTMNDVNATTTNDIKVVQGTVNFPGGVLAIGGTLIDAGGTFVGGTGTVRFYSSVSEIITAGGSSFGSVVFDGTGDWSFVDTDVDAGGDLLVLQGTLTLSGGNFTVGGSYDNNSTVVAGTGTVTFDAVTAGETIDFGMSPLHNVVFDSATGVWTIVSPATTTNAFTLTNANDWTLASGQLLSVGGVFTNGVGGASTTWTGSTLSLEMGEYSINTKNDNGDVYGTLRVSDTAQVKMWNSRADSYVVGAGSLYSQDHDTNDGDLYLWGAYKNTAGAEYWSYATDFDGFDLIGSERPVNVRLASGASATIASSTFEILGGSTASTTIANQGSGTYTVNVIAGTTTAQYYEFSDLGATGVSFLEGAFVPLLRDGLYIVATPGGTAITLSSTTIDVNPAKQIFNVRFATTTAMSGFNVTQTDGVPASYWWFRNGQGNLYGEAFDNDTGDPGTVRFDDSSLVITIAGTVYSDAGSSPIIGGTCNGTTPVVRVVVDGELATTTSCSNVDGSYSASDIVVIGDPTITVFLDDASGGERGSVITRTPTSDILDMDIYANRVIVRNEDVDPLTIANLATFDNVNDNDLQFMAATSTNGNSLTVLAGNELYLFASSTFTPGGVVTLVANATANSYDGTLYLAGDATFNAYSTSTVTIGGRLELATGATFNPADTTVLMNATTTGKSITAPSEITFNDLTFNGASGSWNLGADIRAEGDIIITNGTVTGTGDIYLENGSLVGNGVLSLGGGTTTLATNNTLGGTTAWTFYNLTLGDTLQVGTTTPVFTSTTTVSGRLTINSAHYLDAGSTTWDLAGSGTVLVENGTFIEGLSTIRYSGAGANVLPTQYYNLDINAGAGSPTYTATGLGLIVDGDLTIGGDANTILDINTNDPLLDVNGSVLIRSDGTLSASDSNIFTIAGSYENNGTFISNDGVVTFDGAGTTNILAGDSSFSSVVIDAIGVVTVSEHATTTDSFTLTAADTFTLTSGQSLAVGDTFFNAVGGSATTWTGSTLRLYGGGNYSINATTTSDTYATLEVATNTQIRMWNSDASTYAVAGSGSLYSQDHADVPGDLYIWGAYTQTTANDHWSYATDFDGTSLVGNERKVDVYLASGASVNILGGIFSAVGISTASTTIQNQGTGSYGLLIGGNTNITFNYYELRDMNSSGLVLTGSPTVNTISSGDFEVSQTGGTAMTVGGTVINNNPAKNFNFNRFALNGVVSGFNVTATGTSVSSWRFVNHYGDIDGEAFDVDPDGDPGHVVWDNSAAQITISGRVYGDEGVTVSSACATGEVKLVVAGITSATTTCNTGTGLYSFSNVSYGPNDSLVVYITGATSARGATVTKQPVSNITNLDMYENRVIVRHENTNPMSIVDMAVWDASDDVDIPFTALDAVTDTLTLPADTKLLIWTNKQFAPGGNVTVSGGGAGAEYDGTLELYAGSTWTGAGIELLSIGGSFELGSGAAFVASNGTTTFTTTGTNRTIAVNEGDFNHVVFTGSGSWNITDTTFTVNGNYTQSAGAVTFPIGTSTFSGSLIKSSGTLDTNDGIAVFDSTGNRSIILTGSALADVIFIAGNYSFGDANATATKSVIISGGTVTLPSGTLSIGGDFDNKGGIITHNTSEIVLSSTTSSMFRASDSDLFSVRLIGGGNYSFVDQNIALLGDLLIENNSNATLATGTTAIGGSFDASAGIFTHSSGTILFNSNTSGEFIDAGNSDFYRVQVSAPSGGYTLLGGATTTSHFTLVDASSFTMQSGSVLTVGGVFTNSVGGANTTWSGSTLKLDGQNSYTINTKSTGGDQYDTLLVGENSDIRMWNSAATTTQVDVSSSLYSQDHAGVDGSLHIFGDFRITTMTEYWSYATDFDGVSLVGSERTVTVAHADSATTTVDGGTLRIIGVSGNETFITNQGAGTYAMLVSAGTFQAERYAYRNLNADGLTLIGTPLISSISHGDFELAVDGGTLISLSSTTLNANASLVSTGNRFATTTAITGSNITLTGETANAWTFVSHTGNLSGEAFDVDGVTECGSVRWSNSACLLTQQTQYRWRNDDGGLEVPDSEWFDPDWSARKYIRIKNNDAVLYTDVSVQLLVDYDLDMQNDFDDLRFTASDGVTELPYWIGSSTNGVMAEVWVNITELPAEETTDVYMYFGNAVANSIGSSSLVFLAADDFETGNLNDYSGQTSLFSVDTNFVHGGSFGLSNDGNELGRANLGGIYRLDKPISQGQTIRYWQYIDTSATTDETCVKFAIQNNASVPNDNYGVCVELPGTDRLSLVRNVVDNEASATAILASSTISVSTGWYEIEIEWGIDDSFNVKMNNESGAEIASFSASDSKYTTGGFGFTYWYNSGGWDSFSARKTLNTEPTVWFGVKQGDSGATWKADQNSMATYNVNDIARLRIAVENSGLSIENQTFLLEYAPLDSAPSCEAVNPASYNPVPIQSGCGTSPVCMQNSTYVTNGDSTVDLLRNTSGLFAVGEAREDPSNITGNLNINQNEYTELEYVLTLTNNVVDENLCFRVTDNGSELDTYLRVPRLSLRFDPVISSISLNNGLPISLIPGTTTSVYATGTVSDFNGYNDLVRASSTIYRSGVAGGALCTENNNDCYVSYTNNKCEFVNCAGNDCTISCYADMYFHADPTDAGTYEGQEWFVFVEVEDDTGGYDFATSLGVDLNTLRAIDVEGEIDYGTLEVNADTGSDNASTTILNYGNVEVNIEIQGTDLTDGFNSYVPAEQQKFATSTFTYSACGVSCKLLSSTTPVEIDINLQKPVVNDPPVTDSVYWGIAIPIGVNSAPHQGVNVFTPISS